MRETVLSTSERTFVDKAILEGLRVDKRNLNEFRNLGIFFGAEYGSVLCSLGDTKVFAQASCEVSTPKATRPNEGTLFINVEIGPMAAPHFESGFSMNDTCIQVNRILEKTLRESRCVDLESLCIIAEEKVWNLRVDITILNTDGNLVDCTCIAAVCSLAHFKRPDVTTTGDGEFIIHTPAEKDMIPIVLHHYPICVTYAVFADGSIPVADPTALEERVSDGSLVLAVNSYKELCCMHLIGVVLTSPNLILKCSELAAERSRGIVEFIKSMLSDDEAERSSGERLSSKGFVEFIKLSSVSSNFQPPEEIEEDCEEDVEIKSESSEEEEQEVNPVRIDNKTVASSEWTSKVEEDSENESSSDEEMVAKPVKTKENVETIEVDGSSDEEEATILLK